MKRKKKRITLYTPLYSIHIAFKYTEILGNYILILKNLQETDFCS